MNDQIQETGTQLTATAANAPAQAREHAEALWAGTERQRRKVAKQTRSLQKLAAERGHALGEEAAARGKAVAATAPAVAVAARKKGEHALEVALETARERGGEVLLSALDTDAGKLLASTSAGAALKAKLTARKRRRRRVLLLLVLSAGGAAAFKQLKAKRLRAERNLSAPSIDERSVVSGTGTIPPGATGTAAADPIAGVVTGAPLDASLVNDTLIGDPPVDDTVQVENQNNPS